MSESVVVIAAHAFEARAAAGVGHGMVKEAWGEWTLYRGEVWDFPLAVVRCGPGKVAAAAAAQAAVQYLEPLIIVSFGTAGCPDTGVKVGTVAVATTVVDVALMELGDLPVKIPTRFEPDRDLTQALLAVPGCVASSLFCWEGHVASPVHRPPAGDSAGIVTVDWESAAAAQVAQLWDTPWAALKVVSDHGEAERLRMLAMVAKRPLEWAAEVMRRGCDGYVRQRLDSDRTAVDKGEEA
jgi:adenosylhomocysteine nucleosidase